MYACMWKCDILTSEAHNKKKKKKSFWICQKSTFEMQTLS